MGVGALLAPDKEGGDHGGQDAHGGDNQGINGAGAREEALGGHAQGQGGDDGAHIAFKQIGPHAGHVAHVIAHIVSDNSRVAGVILGDAGLHLAHQVRAHISGLGVDAAAHTGKQGNGGSAQGEAEKNAVIAGENIDQAAAQQAQAHHAHTHDRAAGEGDGQGLGHAAFHGGVGSADVGPGGHLHAEVTGQHGKACADDKADAGTQIDEQRDQHKKNGNENGQNLVL